MNISSVSSVNFDNVIQTEPETEVTQDFETFLKMLTTQIQNQDPLSPMAADQFSNQLASFSMVEQQTATNQKLESLLASFESSGIGTYASIVGRFALHEEPFLFSGAEISFEIAGAPGEVDDRKITIVDASGSIIFEKKLSSNQSSFIWDGKDSDGRLTPLGTYQAELRKASDGTVLDAEITTGGVVEEVRFGGPQAELLLANGTVILEADVATIR